ncbi:MAG: thermonuclease family protein [Deltaproteobacteria bacterium]
MRLLSIAVLATVAISSTAQAGEVPTRVYLNGVPTPVYFNDGDSFKVLGGVHSGTRARLAGFNTLESYGPVHRWGGWDAKELYWLAKLATLNARRGVWHCTSEDLKTDTYGRILWYCPDLARDQIRRGLAHAMTISTTPSDPSYLAAQRQAIEGRRGIWAHGVPAFVMTSLHSSTEGGGREDGTQYNRMVSSLDGHSNSMAHKEAYSECQWVCAEERDVSTSSIAAGVQALRERTDLEPILGDLTEEQVSQIVRDFAHVGWFAWFDDEEDKDKRLELELALAKLVQEGVLPGDPMGEGSCVLYVEFGRRYGKSRPGCLR